MTREQDANAASSRGIAGVDRQNAARDIAAAFAEKKFHRPRDVIGLPQRAPNRRYAGALRPRGLASIRQ